MAPRRVSAAAIEHEYRILTEGCGLLDRSERGKLLLTGRDAVEFLNGQVTNELSDLQAGEGCYAAFLTHKGKMLGDLRILAIGREPLELLLDTERSALQSLFDMIRRFQIGYRVELHKRTLELGMLSLIGPHTDAILAPELMGESEHRHVRVRLGNLDARAIRTAVGIDLVCQAPEKQALVDSLLQSGASPVSEAAAEVVRIERGEPRYGIDLDDSTIPQEAGLNERAVSFTKGCYVGQETVARLHYRGKPNRNLRGLLLSEPAAPGAQLLVGERVAGTLSSCALSPTFGPLGLALVRREAPPGTEVQVRVPSRDEGADQDLADGTHLGSAQVVELPFSAPRESS